MRLIYNVRKISDELIKKATQRIKDKTEDYLEICHLIGIDTNYVNQSIERKDPVTGEQTEFDIPLEYDLYILYYFVTSQVGAEYEIGESIRNIERLKDNPFLNEYDVEIQHEKWVNSRIGFLVHLAKLKLRLLEGDDFSAIEVGTMIGVTGQAIVNRLSRDETLDGKKVKNQWVIKNEDAKEAIRDSKSPFLVPNM
ncbi:MAG: hypothetical protein K9K76_01175 [Halanaerobiales bacterium]|nr:hypothetical protein [Halanaerobiales bacterium]